MAKALGPVCGGRARKGGRGRGGEATEEGSGGGKSGRGRRGERFGSLPGLGTHRIAGSLAGLEARDLVLHGPHGVGHGLPGAALLRLRRGAGRLQAAQKHLRTLLAAQKAEAEASPLPPARRGGQQAAGSGEKAGEAEGAEGADSKPKLGTTTVEENPACEAEAEQKKENG